MLDTIENRNLVSDYIEAKSQLTEWKAKEAKLRVQLLETAFPGAISGNETAEFNDLKIKGSFKFSYKLDAASLEENIATLSEDELSCIAHKPSLVMSKYNALELDEKEALDECVIVSPAMPTLKIEEL